LTDGWLQAVRDHTGGAVVDPVGGDVFDDAIRPLAPEGRLLVLGVEWGEYFLTHPGAEQLVAAGLKPPPPRS
jgi:NADPH:quinone reductase-like Zn-dependent oxidoreductase